MEDDFDVNAAVDDIGAGLGFEVKKSVDDDVVLEVEVKAVPEDKAATDATTAPAPAAADAATTPDTTTPVTAPAADAPPLTWRKEASATWAQLPSEAKAEILKREADIFKGIESYKVDAGFGKSMKTIVAPYENIMRANGVNPEVAVRHLLEGHHVLGTGSATERGNMLRAMAKAYNVDLSTLTEAPAGEAPYVDPQVAALQKELQGVQSFIDQAQNERRQTAVSNISTAVDKFASDPANPYFPEVADQIATLIQRGAANTLQEAYEQAIWTNPTTRAKEIARTTAEAATKTVTEGAAKIAQVRKATAANVTTRAKSGSAATPLGSLDDTLNDALAKIKARG